MPSPITMADLVARYEVILLDAYGVLNDARGALPAGRALLDEIARQGRRFLVVTNDASRLPESCAARFRSFGFDIHTDQVLTSGSLLALYFAENGLHGARCMVLGTEDSREYVRAAGGEIVPVHPDHDCDAIIVCDDSGYPFLETIEDTLGVLYRHFHDRRRPSRPPHLVLPNPDLIYPKGNGQFGFTSGAVVELLERGLRRLFPHRPASELCFTRLGKPHRPMFDEARRRAGTDSLVMIGDQLETDIAGACHARIDSALVATGVSTWNDSDSDVAPTYLLA
jgi:HAD superfamily hydrolase (TIGR01450 family)